MDFSHFRLIALLVVVLVLIVLGLFALVLSTAIVDTQWSPLSIASVVVASLGVLAAGALGVAYFSSPLIRQAKELVDAAEEASERLEQRFASGMGGAFVRRAAASETRRQAAENAQKARLEARKERRQRLADAKIRF